MNLKLKLWKQHLGEKIKGILSFRNVSILLIVPLISIFIYKMVSEPIMNKMIIKESLLETMSTQPEIILDTLIDNLPSVKDSITEEEKNLLKQEITKIMRDNYSTITEKMGLDIDMLIEEVENLKKNTATKQELNSLKEQLGKIKIDLGNSMESNKELDEKTKEEIGNIVESIEKLEKDMEIANQVDNDLADRISKVLDKITDLKKNMNSELDKLRKQLEALEKNTNEKNETQITDVQGKIDALHMLFNSLDARLVEFITAVDIESLNGIITDFALSIATLNVGLNDVQNSVEQIDMSMITLEDMLNSNIENVDEALKGEIQSVLAKMKKLSDDVYDKSIVDSHIQAIQKALDGIMANAGDLDEEMKNKFLQAQKDLENLKQETESGYYDKIAVNNKITEINSSLSDALAQVSNKADKDLQDAILKVESNMTDFGKNVEAAYKKAISDEVLNLKNELQLSINAAAEANKQNAADITDISKSITQLITRLNSLDGDFADLTTQLETVKTLVQSGYYTKEQLDTLLGSVETAMNSIKSDVGSNSTAIANIKTDIVDLDGRVKEVFQSVSDGKGLLASAITGKGINADATESFENLSNKIKLITSSALTGNIKYTYHVHVAGCSSRCSGTVTKYNTRWHDVHKYYIYDYRCSQCAFATEHHRTEPGNYQCSVTSLTCGKTTNTIEKAEIIFGDTRSRSKLSLLDIEEILSHNEREQLKALQENIVNNKKEELETPPEETPPEESSSEESSTEESSTEESDSKVEQETQTESTMEDGTEESETTEVEETVMIESP